MTFLAAPAVSRKAWALKAERARLALGFLIFIFQVQRSRFRDRPRPSHANKLASIGLYKIGQRPARNVPRIESDGERDRIRRRNSDWASRYPHLVILLLWLPERALPKSPLEFRRRYENQSHPCFGPFSYAFAFCRPDHQSAGSFEVS